MKSSAAIVTRPVVRDKPTDIGVSNMTSPRNCSVCISSSKWKTFIKRNTTKKYIPYVSVNENSISAMLVMLHTMLAIM